jgi:hypothetical protein
MRSSLNYAVIILIASMLIWFYYFEKGWELQRDETAVVVGVVALVVIGSGKLYKLVMRGKKKGATK